MKKAFLGLICTIILPLHATNLHVEMSQDFNGDGYRDLFLINKNNQHNLILMEGGKVLQEASPTFLLEEELSLAAAFATDAKSQSVSDKKLASALKYWKARFFGDVDGDGNTDIIFINEKTKKISIQLMDGTLIKEAHKPNFMLNPDLEQKLIDAKTEKQRSVLSKQLSAANALWEITHVADLNGDQKDDILFRHKKSGLINLHLMNGGNVLNHGVLTFGHNQDIRNQISSAPDARTRASLQRLLANSIASWEIQHLADFNKDGKTDLLLINQKTRKVSLQLMNGMENIGSQTEAFSLEPALHMELQQAQNEKAVAIAQKKLDKALINWKLTHVADFNGDAIQDLLYTHKKTKQIHIQIINGINVEDAASPEFGLEPELEQAILSTTDERKRKALEKKLTKLLLYWDLASVGDFNGDQKNDLLFIHKKTKQVRIRLLDGLKVIDSDEFKPNLEPELRAQINTAATTKEQTKAQATYNKALLQWELIQVQDFNGDSKHDLLFRNKKTFQVNLHLLNGTQVNHSESLNLNLESKLQQALQSAPAKQKENCKTSLVRL